jgi:hypothetical protein
VKILVKSLIVWFLLLAVPFQGFASATMLFCVPLESPASTTISGSVPAPDHDHDHDHDHAAMLTGEHAQHDHHAQDDHALGQHDSHDGTSGSHHDGGKCNSCAACCFGAAMGPSDSVRLPVETQQFTAVPFDTGFVPAVDLALPERPPQASLS